MVLTALCCSFVNWLGLEAFIVFSFSCGFQSVLHVVIPFYSLAVSQAKALNPNNTRLTYKRQTSTLWRLNSTFQHEGKLRKEKRGETVQKALICWGGGEGLEALP